MKRRINITLDEDVYSYFMVFNNQKYNVSSLCNVFLKSFLDMKENNKERIEIESELELLNVHEKELLNKKIELHSYLAKIKSDEEKHLQESTQLAKQELERANFVNDTIRASGKAQEFFD